MPKLNIRGADLHYSIAGTGPQTIVFIHGLMLASESWHHQVAAFRDRYRVVTFDLRGQGRSDKTTEGLDLDSLALDVVALIGALNLGPCHLVGFSMGTFIAMRVAVLAPEMLETLTLIGPSAEAEDPARMPRYRALIALVRVLGARPFVRPLLKILFGDTFLNHPARRFEVARWRGYLRDLPRSLHRAAAASAHRRGIVGSLGRIVTPTLVVSGAEDRPIPTAKAQAVADGIAGARMLVVPATGHAVMLERPEVFNAALDGFLGGRTRLVA